MNNFFRLPIFLRGIAMGSADVVPGVSGGTIAFITGIYEELILTIKNLDFEKLAVWKKQGFSAFWDSINGSFLLSLLLGIAVSILSLARLITYLLTNHPILLFAFFFGLIVASAVYIGRQITDWDWKHFLILLVCIAAAYYITLVTPAGGSSSFLYLFLCGAIAICAMILPGISGAFILLLLGQYNAIIEALKTVNFSIIIPVGLGAIIGILSFSRILGWFFNNYKTMTLAGLTGFVIGALNKVWPWKEVIETYTDSHGDIQPLVEKSILPTTFTQITGEPNHLLPAIGLAIVGFFVVFGLERIATPENNE